MKSMVGAMRALDMVITSFSAVGLRLATNRKYCLVHDPQLCSENANAVEDSLLTLSGVFVVALPWVLIWSLTSTSPL